MKSLVLYRHYIRIYMLGIKVYGCICRYGVTLTRNIVVHNETDHEQQHDFAYKMPYSSHAMSITEKSFPQRSKEPLQIIFKKSLSGRRVYTFFRNLLKRTIFTPFTRPSICSGLSVR